MIYNWEKVEKTYCRTRFWSGLAGGGLSIAVFYSWRLMSQGKDYDTIWAGALLSVVSLLLFSIAANIFCTSWNLLKRPASETKERRLLKRMLNGAASVEAIQIMSLYRKCL